MAKKINPGQAYSIKKDSSFLIKDTNMRSYLNTGHRLIVLTKVANVVTLFDSDYPADELVSSVESFLTVI